jgi:5-(carboxyamino)imidazole ribonucleotide synthase
MQMEPAQPLRILPGATIGILGGGQLGRMLALKGQAMGYRFVTLDPTPDSPCGQVCQRQIVASYGDEQAAREMAALAQVITYEFENVNAQVALALEQQSYVPQGSNLLRTTQHRWREKQAISAAGIPVAPYVLIHTLSQLREAFASFGTSCVLKTATGGYDGKGQVVIHCQDQVAEAFMQLGSGSVELVLEQFIAFERELSVIAVRGLDGEVRTFPPAENAHIGGILHTSIVSPQTFSPEIVERAQQLARTLARSLQVVGLLAVEMFLTKEGQLYVNELAPRPHNSGHYTMDACNVSQFEMHLRAICGLPLPEPSLLTPVMMINLLGEHMSLFQQWLQQGGERALPDGVTAKVHLYGKSEAKSGRKMGHVNLLTDDPAKAMRWIHQANIWSANKS